MSGRGAALVGSEGMSPSTTIPIGDVFVSIDLEANVAYVAYESTSGLRWKELSRADGELLATLGASSQVLLRPSGQPATTVADHAARTADERAEAS